MHRYLWTFAVLLSCGEVIPLGRGDYNHYVTTCSGGINQSAERANIEQCADAVNVWAPDGKVVTRPGYEGLIAVPLSGAATSLVATAEDTSASLFTNEAGSGVLTLGTAGSGATALVGRVTSGGNQDRWYLGHSATFSGCLLALTAANTNATRFKAEYWNGSEWKYLHVTETDVTEPFGSSTHLSGASAVLLLFVAPQDWATKDVNSRTKYWIRFNLLDADVAAATAIDVIDGSTLLLDTPALKGLFAPQFASSKRYIYVSSVSGTDDVIYINSNSADLHDFCNYQLAYIPGEPASMAVVPQFEEAFIASNYDVSRHIASPTASDSITATVETGDFAIGDGAPYDDAYIAQLSEFPKAKYISFFRGSLWAANLQGEPYSVRWSAPAPFHKVWPSLSVEVLAENDNSPITGLHPLGEFQTVFKQDSIWMAYDTGLDAFGLQTYALRQVVAGVGAVSNSSIKAIRGNLIFLAEDGLYRFDGATATKVSLDPETGVDRLKDLWPSINPGRRPFAAAAHWRTKHAYLLSFSTTGSNVHDTTLVWDYDRDTFWIWDNIDAQHWLEDEGNFDSEELYFGDSSGRIYRMGGQTDHGGVIDITLTTQRLGFYDRTKQRVRQVTAFCTNRTREVDLEIMTNDASSGTTATLSYTDSAEADWSDFTYSTDSYTATRRRLKGVSLREDFDWVQVKITHDQKYQPFELAYIDVATLPISRNRT